MNSTTVAADVAARDRVWFVGGAVFVLVAVVIAVSIGPAGPEWWRVPLALLDHLPVISLDSGVSDNEWAIVWKVRMPRVVLGCLVGGMLSIAGAGYQGVFRNPLVDPYLLGAAAGAGLGATIALTIGRSATAGWVVDPVPVVAFGFAVATVMVTYSVGAAFGGSRSGVTLVLAGVAVVSFTSAAQTFVLQRNLDAVREVFRWILGSLSNASWGDVRLVAPYVVVSSIGSDGNWMKSSVRLKIGSTTLRAKANFFCLNTFSGPNLTMAPMKMGIVRPTVAVESATPSGFSRASSSSNRSQAFMVRPPAMPVVASSSNPPGL